MSVNAFITEIAAYVRKYAPLYNIRVYSPIIAQAILESGRGTSELAMNANNFFGLKWRENRCPTASGYYVKVGSEQNPDGSYTSSVMKWCKFPNAEACVQGYFDFINNERYANLKGVTDPETYLQNIRADGYATSLKYVENLMNVIKSYDLTKFDSVEEKKMLKIALDAGHGLYTSGKRCKKSLDPSETREWMLNKRIAERLYSMLGAFDCEVLRVDNNTGKTDPSLANRCKIANTWGADIYISIHHNAGINGGSGGGTVVFYYSSNTERKAQAFALYNAVVSATGLIGNRSGKVNKKGYYVLKHTKCPAFLIENGFMDSATDVPIILSDSHAAKTAQGILDFLINTWGLKRKSGSAEVPEASEKVETPKTPENAFAAYRVKVTALVLNVRAGAGTNFKKTTSVKLGEVFTIVEEKMNGSTKWGKLKSGAGWISLKYTKKV